MVRKFNRTIALAGAIFLGSLAWSTYAGAAEPGRALPESGRIDMINPDRTSIVINDRLFLLSPYVHVWTSEGRETSLDRLKTGTTINFSRVNQGQPGRDVITEIQVTAE